MTPIASHRLYALGAFRWSVFFFFAIAAFSERDGHTRSILAATLFVLDVVSWNICEAISLTGGALYNHVWLDTLTNRFILEKLADRVKLGQPVEVPVLIQESRVAAKEDVEDFVRANTIWADWGGFKKTLHATGYFVWWWVSYGIFYGTAGAIGQAIR